MTLKSFLSSLFELFGVDKLPLPLFERAQKKKKRRRRRVWLGF